MLSEGHRLQVCFGVTQVARCQYVGSPYILPGSVKPWVRLSASDGDILQQWRVKETIPSYVLYSPVKEGEGSFTATVLEITRAWDFTENGLMDVGRHVAM